MRTELLSSSRNKPVNSTVWLGNKPVKNLSVFNHQVRPQDIKYINDLFNNGTPVKQISVLSQFSVKTVRKYLNK
jgi:hypothetical protein